MHHPYDPRHPGQDDEPTASASIHAAWRNIDPTWLVEPPPARRWLLRHPTRDGREAPPAQGDGLLPLGKVGLFVADGGTGKTMSLVSLAVSVITGREWLSYFHVDYAARGGHVLLALGEEDAEELHRRLYTVSTAYNLTDSECELVAARLVVLPLAGNTVRLVSAEGQESVELQALRERLQNGPESPKWSLVALDPYSRFAGAESELDNAVATRTVQALETLVHAPGGPSVVVAHHAPQQAVTSGQIRSRGVTALKDGVRWEATLRADKHDVWFRQSKSNYSIPMPEEIRLVREPGGLLRAASASENDELEALRSEAKEASRADKDARREARIAALEEALVVALLEAERPPTSQRTYLGMVPGTQSEKVDALSRLLAEGRVIRPEDKGSPYRLGA